MDKNKYGITGAVRGFFNSKTKQGYDDVQVALDEALQTTPNIGVPSALTAFVDTSVSTVLYSPTRLTEVFPEIQKGTWTTAYSIFPVEEATGEVAGYSDFATNGMSSVNATYPTRPQLRLQTNIRYGDFETEVAAEAKLNLVASKQKAAAKTVVLAQNAIYAYGVAGTEIYGYLNDPNKTAAIVAPNGASGQSEWSTKDSTEMYEDIVYMIGEFAKANDLLQPDMPFVLSVAPESAVQLTKATTFNVSALDMIKKNYPNLRMVTLPELQGDDLRDTSVEITLDEIQGEQVGLNGFGEKYRVGRTVAHESWFSQKISFSTYGCIIKHYEACFTMIGV